MARLKTKRISVMVGEARYNELKQTAIKTHRTITACAEIAIKNHCEMAKVEIEYLAEKSFEKRFKKVSRRRGGIQIPMSAAAEQTC